MILVENHHFFISTMQSTCLLGGGEVPLGSAIPFGMEKLEWLGYLTVEKILGLFVFTWSTKVTDTHTHTDTSWRHRPHSSGRPLSRRREITWRFPDGSQHSSVALGMLRVTHIMPVLVLLSVVGLGINSAWHFPDSGLIPWHFQVSRPVVTLTYA